MIPHSREQVSKSLIRLIWNDTFVLWFLFPSRRRGGDMIHHSREQVSKSPATWPYNEFIILQSLKTFTIKSIIRHSEWFATAVNKFPSPLPPDRTTNLLYCKV